MLRPKNRAMLRQDGVNEKIFEASNEASGSESFVRKGSQARFEFIGPLPRLLRVLPPHAIVFGVGTEYCVKLVCLGIRRAGVPVALVTDATRALAPNTEKEALEEMRKAGVEFITLETLLGAGAA